MNRRRFVVFAGGTLALPSVLAQVARVWRIGYLASSPPRANEHALAAFRNGMRDLGYVEGKNRSIEYLDGGRCRRASRPGAVT